jgi:hypothetical protein
MTYQSAWLSVMVPPDIDMGLTSGDIVARWVKFFAARCQVFRRQMDQGVPSPGRSDFLLPGGPSLHDQEGQAFRCQLIRLSVARRARFYTHQVASAFHRQVGQAFDIMCEAGFPPPEEQFFVATWARLSSPGGDRFWSPCASGFHGHKSFIWGQIRASFPSPDGAHFSSSVEGRLSVAKEIRLSVARWG